MFSYVVKGHDRMFPGRPNLYFYGWGPARRKPGKIAPLFGPEIEKAFVIEASTQECAKMVAEILAKQYQSASLLTWVSRLVPLEEA